MNESPIYDALLAEGAHPEIRPCLRHDCTAEAVNDTGYCLQHLPGEAA